MSEKSLDLAGTGSMVVDRLCATTRLIGADEKVLLRPDSQGRIVNQRVGGVVLNQLGWARLFGLRVGVFGRQADDADGRFLRRAMTQLGIETSLDLSGSASSFAQIYVDPEGGRAIYMARGATGELSASQVDASHAAMIAGAQVVTTEISQVPLGAVIRVLESAREAGAVGVLDVDVPLHDAVPSLGEEEELHAALSAASVLKASLSSLRGLVDVTDPADVAKHLERRYAPDAVVLTLGGARTFFGSARLSAAGGPSGRAWRAGRNSPARSPWYRSGAGFRSGGPAAGREPVRRPAHGSGDPSGGCAPERPTGPGRLRGGPGPGARRTPHPLLPPLRSGLAGGHG